MNTWSNTNLSWALDSIMVWGWSSPSSSSSVGNWLFFRGSPGCAGDIWRDNRKIHVHAKTKRFIVITYMYELAGHVFCSFCLLYLQVIAWWYSQEKIIISLINIISYSLSNYKAYKNNYLCLSSRLVGFHFCLGSPFAFTVGWRRLLFLLRSHRSSLRLKKKWIKINLWLFVFS